jgi:1-acyl-sn-glycerol-3-phosphate acyltransferase
VYPEGTRNRTGQPLKSFYDGAFRLACSTGKDIIPVVILHTAKALPPSVSFFLWPTALEMHLLKPVSSAGKSQEELKEEVRQQMWDFIEAH